ncbi:MAG: hypothetical protein KF685_04850 [Acidobacteria bacterium]|nr:hypothetical protein [Acidobacteriota bacterium]
MNEETRTNTEADSQNADQEWQDIAELESLRRENEELRSEVRHRDARESIVTGLRNAGAISPDLLYGTIRPEIEFDEAGKAANADGLIADLRRKYPDQFTSARPAEAIDAGAGTQRQPQPLSKDALGRMSPDEIRRLDWADVREALSRR